MLAILHLSTDWREVDRDDSAFHAHFPDLKSLARDHLKVATLAYCVDSSSAMRS